MYTLVFVYGFLIYNMFYSKVTHTHHLGFQMKSPPPRSIVLLTIQLNAKWLSRVEGLMSTNQGSVSSLFSLTGTLKKWLSILFNDYRWSCMVLGFIFGGAKKAMAQLQEACKGAFDTHKIIISLISQLSLKYTKCDT